MANYYYKNKINLLQHWRQDKFEKGNIGWNSKIERNSKKQKRYNASRKTLRMRYAGSRGFTDHPLPSRLRLVPRHPPLGHPTPILAIPLRAPVAFGRVTRSLPTPVAPYSRFDILFTQDHSDSVMCLWMDCSFKVVIILIGCNVIINCN